MKIALLCGGPSQERGISLNSARSVLDHLESEIIEILPFYFDYQKKPYRISKAQLYSNTPSDFDFKLKDHAEKLNEKSLVQALKKADLVFPVIHGKFGEDGQIQHFLERYDIPYVGSDSKTCKIAFDKYNAGEFIKAKGFFTLPTIVLEKNKGNPKKSLEQFFKRYRLRRAIVKPTISGSSIGVYSVGTVAEALAKADHLFAHTTHRVVVEPFCTGKEFTVIILQNRLGMPTALIPTEIEANYTQHQIFDYRKKYLPTNQVRYHCPPTFDNQTVECIQIQAEELFSAFGMRDFARFDGWVLPDGKIWFSDFNPISGMEQNSFLFQQASRISFSHGDVLRYIVKNACRRAKIPFPSAAAKKSGGQKIKPKPRKKINVLFGGQTSERQVSLMSGTNVWLKLRKSKKYESTPFLLDLHNTVWELPYALTLNHTVEEIAAHCRAAPAEEKRLHFLAEKVKLRLALESGETTEPFFLPRRLALREFIKKSKYIFIGLHGGMGEDGTLQRVLQKEQVAFNGSDATASVLCMDKWQTNQYIESLAIPGVSIAPQKKVELKNRSKFLPAAAKNLWDEIIKTCGGPTIIVKPVSDGCSSGIVRLYSAKELEKYIALVKKRAPSINPHTFAHQSGIIEMPLSPIKTLLFEKFIETDAIKVEAGRLEIKRRSGWVEITVGVYGKHRRMHALNPSVTIAEGGVLSVEEKFQGGTGINITPPSKEIISPNALRRAKKLIERVANAVGISGYARIDAFLNTKTGEIMIIEVNTLPALTPSTVLFHQALAERKPLYPVEFLEKIIRA